MRELKKEMRISKMGVVMALLVGCLLTGCASQSLKAPCPDYGKNCDKTPVNSWDTSTV